MLNARVYATGAVYDVSVYYGPTDGGTDPAAWSNAVNLGWFTNMETAVNQAAVGLMKDTTYYYTFRATNDASDIWAEPSVEFTTHGLPKIENVSATPQIGYAVLRGNMIETNGAPTTAIIYWGTTDGTNNASYKEKSGAVVQSELYFGVPAFGQTLSPNQKVTLILLAVSSASNWFINQTTSSS